MKRQEFENAALPHLDDLYRTATRLLADSTKADDVVQDVYLQAWKSFDRFEVGTNCRAWLYKYQSNNWWRELTQKVVVGSPKKPVGPATNIFYHFCSISLDIILQLS